MCFKTTDGHAHVHADGVTSLDALGVREYFSLLEDCRERRPSWILIRLHPFVTLRFSLSLPLSPSGSLGLSLRIPLRFLLGKAMANVFK